MVHSVLMCPASPPKESKVRATWPGLGGGGLFREPAGRMEMKEGGGAEGVLSRKQPGEVMRREAAGLLPRGAQRETAGRKTEDQADGVAGVEDSQLCCCRRWRVGRGQEALPQDWSPEASSAPSPPLSLAQAAPAPLLFSAEEPSCHLPLPPPHLLPPASHQPS